jgi:hypothetical protein
VHFRSTKINQPQDAEFFSAILLVLDDQANVLPEEHPYTAALNEFWAGTTAGELQDKETSAVISDEEEDALPFDAELILRSIEAFWVVHRRK